MICKYIIYKCIPRKKAKKIHNNKRSLERKSFQNSPVVHNLRICRMSSRLNNPSFFRNEKKNGIISNNNGGFIRVIPREEHQVKYFHNFLNFNQLI